MAKIRVIKKKKKLRLDRIASVLFCIGIMMYLGARMGVRSYNYSLSIKAEDLNKKRKKLENDIAALKSDIERLQNRDRVLAIAEDDDIVTRQDNVTVIRNE